MWYVFCLLEWQSFWTSSSTLETQLSRWNNFLILPVPKCSVVFQMSSLKCINIYICFYFTSSKKHYFSHFSPTKSSCTSLQMWNKAKDRMGKRATGTGTQEEVRELSPMALRGDWGCLGQVWSKKGSTFPPVGQALDGSHETRCGRGVTTLGWSAVVTRSKCKKHTLLGRTV